MCYVCSERKDKYEYYLTGNHIINIKIYKISNDKFLVCFSCSQEEDLHIRREEVKYK